jgi:hypothetical protein
MMKTARAEARAPALGRPTRECQEIPQMDCRPGSRKTIPHTRERVFGWWAGTKSRQTSACEVTLSVSASMRRLCEFSALMV